MIARALLAAGCMLLAGTSGCQSPPATTSPPGPGPGHPDPIDEAAIREQLALHNARVAQLDRIAAPGVIEFAWVDEAGDRHFEPQVNTRLWIDLPRRSGLRLEKLGEVLFWLGSDDERYWLFDLTGAESTLFVRSHHDAISATGGSALRLRPLAIIDLLGLTPVPLVDDLVLTAEPSGWQVTAPGAGGEMRLSFADGSAWPHRVESLDRGGVVTMHSRLDRPRSVIVEGVSRAALPRMPTLIDIADPAGTITVKLALDEPSPPRAGAPWERFFDLEQLRGHLRPTRVDEAAKTTRGK